eukprot:5398550-Pleurochrysis_carterae.AAC.6
MPACDAFLLRSAKAFALPTRSLAPPPSAARPAPASPFLRLALSPLPSPATRPVPPSPALPHDFSVAASRVRIPAPAATLAPPLPADASSGRALPYGLSPARLPPASTRLQRAHAGTGAPHAPSSPLAPPPAAPVSAAAAAAALI